MVSDPLKAAGLGAAAVDWLQRTEQRTFAEPADPARSVAPETALRQTLPLFAAASAPVWVVEDGRTLGAVTPQAVFETLAPRT